MTSPWLPLLLSGLLGLLLGFLLSRWSARSRSLSQMAKALTLPRKPQPALTAASQQEQMQSYGQRLRNQGRFDEAIGYHQSLLAEPGWQAFDAMLRFELAEDFFSAGLFDRAETLYFALLKQQYDSGHCLDRLGQIAASTQDWQRIVQLFSDQELSSKQRLLLLHARCYVLEQYLLLDMPQSAQQLLKVLLKQAPSHPRVQACQALLLVEKQQPQALLAPRGAPREPQQQTTTWQDFAEQAEFRLAADFRQLLRLASAQGASLVTLERVLASRGLLQPSWHCKECGFISKQHHWQCPQCQSWETIEPR